jgi:poly(A)-specific ribonuclease
MKVGNYVAKPFNFFVSPALDPIFGFDRTFLCQSSAMEMLCHEGMDFNYLLRHGIRYLSHDEEREIRAREADLADGVREPITIDVGGEKFLASVRLSTM